MCKWSGEASLRPLWGFRSQEESRLSPLEHCPTRHSPPQFMPHINLHPPLIHNQTPSIHKASSACIIYVSYVSRTRLYNICQQTITIQNEYWGWQHNDSSITSWDRFFFFFHCVTQLMLYTGDKLSSPIFTLWVCEASVSPNQISTFSNVYRHTSPLLTMYHLISSSTNL